MENLNKKAMLQAFKDMQKERISFPKAFFQHFKEGNDFSNPGIKRPKFLLK